MSINRKTLAVFLSIAVAASLGGCYIPLASEARFRDLHANARSSPESKALVQKQLAQLSCFHLSEWEQVVLYYVKAGDPPELSRLSLPILLDDLARIRETMAMRGCPSRSAMLTAGTPPPEKGSMLRFACACWRPAGITPIVKEGAGPAGPACFTVRAEVSPGAFTIIENVPTWGDRRHEIDRSDSLVLGGLDGGALVPLVQGLRLVDFSLAPDARIGWMDRDEIGAPAVPDRRLQAVVV